MKELFSRLRACWWILAGNAVAYKVVFRDTVHFAPNQLASGKLVVNRCTFLLGGSHDEDL